MAQKLQIEVEANLSGYTASLKEAAQDNVELSDSAKKSAAEVSAAYKQVGQVQRAAFGGEETKKALANQTSEIERLRTNLEKLYKEEIQLLSSGKKLTDEYKKNREEAAKVRAEFDKLLGTETKRNQEIDKTTNKTVKLTTQLRDLKQQLSLLEQQGQSNTKEFEQIAIAAARLEDQIGDTQERIKVLSSDTFVFDAAIDSVNALAGGFAVAQGAIGLFAEDNEELQRAIAKTNSALAILNGLQQIQAFFTGQSAGKLGILTLAQNAYAAAVGKGVAAMKVFRLALIATGIGAAVVAIGFLVENFDRLRDAAYNVIPGLRDVGEFIGKVIDKAKELIGITDKESDGALDRFVKREQRKLDFQVNAISRQIELQKALGNETAKLEIKREQLQLDFAKRRLDLVKKNEEAIRAANIDTEKILFDLDQEVLDRKNKIAILQISKEKEITIAISDEIRRRAFEVLKYDEIVQESLRSQFDDASLQTSLRTRIQVLKNFASVSGELTRERLEFENAEIKESGELQKEIIKQQLLDGTIDKAEADAIIIGIDNETTEKLKQNNKDYRDAVIANTIQIAQAFQSTFSSIFALSNQLRDNQISELEEQKNYELELVGNNLQARERIEKKYAQEKRKLEREQAVAEKNQAIFQAIIATAVAVVNALKTPVIGPVLAAAAGIAGAAQIATIASTPLPKLERGGRIGGRRHVQGGTIIEAEKDEFVVSRTPAIKHSRELEAMNRSSRDYMSYIDKAYVRPAVMDAILTVKRDEQKVNVNATLDSRRMENELRSLRRESKKGNKMLASALQTKSNDRYRW